MIIKDIMSSPVYTIEPNVPATQANELMWRYQVHHLVVSDGNGIVGIISDTDLGGEHANEIPDRMTVKDAMTSTVTTVTPDTLIDKAANLMKGNGFHSLPVVDENGTLLGIVTQTDLERLQKRGKAQGPTTGDPRQPIRTFAPSVPKR